METQASIDGYDEFSNMLYLIDFEDSFTFNIANEIWNHFKVEVEVHSFRMIEKIKVSKKDSIILGPGPGHPNEYKKYYELIQSWMNTPSINVIGICLGHQILWSIMGANTYRSGFPLHGQTVDLKLDKFWKSTFETNKEIFKVQRYNSLVVESSTLEPTLLTEYHCLFFENELMASLGEKFLSFQFHPESIGTENSKNILGCLLRYAAVR